MPVANDSSSNTIQDAAADVGGNVDLAQHQAQPAPVTIQNLPTDRTPGQDPSSQLAAAGQSVVNVNDFTQSQLEQYGQDLWQMEVAGRPNSGTIVFPPGVGPAEFAELETNLDAFAASAGYQYFPTSAQIDQMLRQGLATADQSQVFQWLANVNGVAGKMPWAATGLTKTQYDQTQSELQSTMAQYTGDPNMYGNLVQEALSKFGNSGAASSWLTTQLTTNKAYTQNSKTPWLQYGMQYQQWQQWKLQNKAQVQQIAGYGNLSEAQQASVYAQMQASPTRQQTGSAVTMGSGGGQGTLVTSSGQSSVR